jgi:hypothetical protein
MAVYHPLSKRWKNVKTVVVIKIIILVPALSRPSKNGVKKTKELP